jgi:cholesterol oxidase
LGDDTHFDVVVVGSGFGGSVMAYRLAQAGKRVCLLERGRAWPPESFPRSPYRMQANVWDSSEGLHGLFSIWSFRRLAAIVASGLGGGSLIYANVLIRKDERWFVREHPRPGGYEYWPVTRADLDPHYDRVEAMLRPEPYPLSFPPYDRTPRTRAVMTAARRLRMDWSLPNLAIAFATGDGPPVPGEPLLDAPPNLHDRTRSTCRLCGECVIGCNYGSKNTLDYNYLSAAKLRHGADIRTGCEVKSFEPLPGGGFAVHYVKRQIDGPFEPPTSPRPLPTTSHTLTARKLVLAAGTLGTTFLLLKNRGALPGLSRRVGTGFSGNGDLLTLAVGGVDRTGPQPRPLVIDGGFGPVITSAIRFPDALDDTPDGRHRRGFYIEDAGYPEFLNWVLQTLDTPGALWRARAVIGRLAWKWWRGNPERDLSAEVSALFGRAQLSSGVLPLLGMGRDVADGTMRLRGGLLDVDWRKHGRSRAYFDRVRATMHALADAMGACFIDNPISLLNRLITVHPLGGCPMGRDAREGVVDPYGRAFGYPDLVIADGAVMPGPVGPNPGLTIAALADRFADRLIDDLSARVP